MDRKSYYEAKETERKQLKKAKRRARYYKINNLLWIDFWNPVKVLFVTIGIIINILSLHWAYYQNAVHLFAAFSCVEGITLLLMVGNLIWSLQLEKKMREAGEETIIPQRKHIVGTISSTKRIRIETDDIELAEKDRFIFATIEDIRTISEINNNVSKDSLFGIEKSKKRKRNRSHVTRNDHSILAVFSCDEQRIIGFSHIFPTDNYTWYTFKEGGISDCDFDKFHVARAKKEKITDNAFGLIICTVAVNPFNNETDSLGENNILLTKAVAYHIKHFLLREFKYQQIVPVAYQTINRKVLRGFKAYQTNIEQYSKDRVRVLCFEIENNFAILPTGPIQHNKPDEPRITPPTIIKTGIKNPPKKYVIKRVTLVTPPHPPLSNS